MSKAIRTLSTLRALALLPLAASACKDADTTSFTEPASASDGREYRVSTKNDVQWKRYAAFENDLALALELDPANLCTELGQASCIRQVHLMPLGGNDPFDTGILLPTAEPLATTPAVVDRVLLSACGQRVALDRQAPAGQAAVFKALDLNGPAPAPGDAAVATTITDLYHRLLAREPSADERGIVAELARSAAGEPIAAADFATLACFAVGGSTEFLFY
ncbi:MAG TPA: hypothetical protein VNN80_17065 [Polyangiaceae bacterium]|nr:hypothetical protein [Polyangiaceae bacterium]